MTEVTQLCYATCDLQMTARTMIELDRVGPFYLAEFPLRGLVYRGERVNYGSLKVAFAYRGHLQVELVQVPAGLPSCYAEVLNGRREALHHTYVKSEEDYDAIVERHASAGEELVYHGLAGDDGIRFGFIDARVRLGHFIEVLESNRMIGSAAAMFGLYERMEGEARRWDGSSPVRSLTELA